MLPESEDQRRRAAVDLLEAALAELDALDQSVPAAHLCLALDMLRRAPADRRQRSEKPPAASERL